MKYYWCMGKDSVGRSFSVMIEAPDEPTMWAKLDSRFGCPVDRDGLVIGYMTNNKLVKLVFGQL